MLSGWSNLSHNLAARDAWPGVAVLLSVLWLGFSLQSAEPSYTIRTWYVDDGLPQNAVADALQTRDGYLWLGTFSGLARFDGVRFVVFNSNNTPGLKNSRITSLYEGRDGTLWIGHETGDITRFRDGRFQPVPIDASWDVRKLFDMGEDHSGDIWLMNTEGLLKRVRDGKRLVPAAGEVMGMVTMTCNKAGDLWVSRNGKVSELREGELHTLSFGQETTDLFAFGICASKDDGLWVVADGRIRKWDGMAWTEDRGATPWGLTPLTTFAELSNGVLAAGTSDRGLFLIPPSGAALNFSRTNGLSHDWVRSLCEDREDNLWVGTGTGLSMLRQGCLTSVAPPDGWQGCAVLSATSASDGSIWVGTEGAGVYRWREGVWTNFASGNSGLQNNFVWSVAEDGQDRIWAGTWGSGVFVRRADDFEPAPRLEDFRIPVTALLPARRGGLWIGTGEGLMRYDSSRITTFGTEAGLESPDVRSVLETEDGTVWFGMYAGGLGRLRNGELRQFRTRDGLTSDFVQCLKFDEDGALWIGTAGGGLNRLKNEAFASVSTRHGLPNDVICHIEEDGLGNFWVSSYGGIFRVAKAELDACADGMVSKVHGLGYGTSDGLPTLECSGGLQPAGCRSRDGKLWFPTSKGLAVLDPSTVTTNLLAPPVVIEEFRVDGHPMDKTGADAVQIEPGHQRFGFYFTALSFVAPERVRFRCWLEGMEDEWADLGPHRDVSYNFLPPGDYVFHVTACNNDEIWNEDGVSLAFVVLPHFWQTIAFRVAAALSVVLAAGSLAWFAARRRMRRRMEKLERQRALERERARISKDIHDDLGASLTRITLLSQSARSELDDNPEAAAEVDRIYTTARELTRAMDEIVWAVNPQHDTLDSLTIYLGKFAQDYLRAAGIRCRLQLPEQLPDWPLSAELRHNLFLAMKEAFHNVIKHASATEVQVRLTLDKHSFTWEVEDNGTGFLEGDLSRGSADRVASGNGLQNMRRRLEDVGGRCTVESAPGTGTQVRFWLPWLPAR